MPSAALKPLECTNCKKIMKAPKTWSRLRHEFALITDLDKASRDPSKLTWHAWFRRGLLWQLPASEASH